jgi:hypothetical protein
MIAADFPSSGREAPGGLATFDHENVRDPAF